MDNAEGYTKLSRSAVKAWRINGILWSLVSWAVPIYVGVIAYGGAEVPFWVIIAALAAALAVTALLVFIIPEIRWRQWKYRVDKHEIDLHHGIWFTQRTLVPVKRIQHVDTRQGPVLRQYGLADVVISTAATTHKIPALAEDIADEMRRQISTFARKAKEDV